MLQGCGDYRHIATWDTSQMTRCGTPNERSSLEKTFPCCLLRAAHFTPVMGQRASHHVLFLHREEWQKSCSHRAGALLLPSRSEGTRTACFTTVQSGSDLLNSIESQCSVTDLSFWKKKGYLEGTCCSPFIRLRLKNSSSHL